MGSIRSRIEYILKHNLVIQNFYKIFLSLFFKFIGLFIKIDDKLILFNAHGRKYNDSPKAIFEFIIGNELYKDYKLVWALDEPEKYNIPKATKIKIDTLKYFIYALRSKYWVSCVNIERGLNFKKKETIYLNTWHGIPLKKVGNSVIGREDFNFSSIDIFCCSGKYEMEIYKKDFNVLEDNLFFTGLPRNDELYNVSRKKINDCKKNNNIPIDKKVILYAPTWRESIDNGKSYSLDAPINFKLLQEELEEDYVFLLRTHTYTNKMMKIEFNEFIRDFSTYPDVNDLLIIADILISDYSATIFDYSILERPIICFGYDYKSYSAERGFYFDLEKELPGGVLKTQEELLKKIKTMNYQKECKKTLQFKNAYIEIGSEATIKCVEKLIN